jgi:hypothetical protein
MKKNDYLSLVREYSLSQFREMEGYKEACIAIASFFFLLQDDVEELLTWTDVDKAERDLLTYIGYLFGVYREYFDLSQYFCVNHEDVNEEKYFYFERSSGFVLPAGSLDDRELRQRIKAKIGTLYSKYTRNDNIKVIKFLTMSDRVIITKNETMALEVELIGDSVFVTDKTFSEIEGVLGDGVGLNKLTINGKVTNGNR